MRVLDTTFDVVYTSQGALCWLPDIRRWVQIVARFVAPGGACYLFEAHPFAFFQMLPFLKQGGDGWWHLPDGLPSVPLSFSIRAVKA